MRLWMMTILAAALSVLPAAAAEQKTGGRFDRKVAGSPASEQKTGGRRFDRKVAESPSVVYLKGFHSATQRGPTCNVYSTWMILRYYKFHITPGQIKKGAKNGEYKTSAFIEDKLDAVNFCFLVYHPKQGADFGRVVKTCIDNGIPLQWGVNLKYAPKAKVRRLGRTRDAGHARVIWGYVRDRRTGEVTGIIFADSWGRRKLRQKVDVDEACHMTMSMHPVFPRDTDPEVVAKLLAIPGMSQGDVPDSPGSRPDRKPDKNYKGKNTGRKKKTSGGDK